MLRHQPSVCALIYDIFLMVWHISQQMVTTCLAASREPAFLIAGLVSSSALGVLGFYLSKYQLPHLMITLPMLLIYGGLLIGDVQAGSFSMMELYGALTVALADCVCMLLLLIGVLLHRCYQVRCSVLRVAPDDGDIMEPATFNIVVPTGSSLNTSDGMTPSN